MKITQDEIVDRQTLLHIELEDEDTAPYIDRGYRRLVQRVSIPGFRKGKAPRSIVENYFGREALLRESLDQMVSEVTSRAIEEQELETAGLPSIELLELEPVTVEAKVALTPTVGLGSYKELRVPEEPVETSEDDVQQRLDELQKGIAPWEPVERPVDLGDMITVTVQGTVDGKTMLDQKNSVIVVEAGSVVPLPGFAEQLAGTAPRNNDGQGSCSASFGGNSTDPATCKEDADCAADCPPDALGCACVASPNGKKRCLPACESDADCPAKTNGALVCHQAGHCVPGDLLGN